MPEEKNPVDQVIDLLVFAPLGLALTARNELPEMVAKGRAQVENQLTMARFIGQFAVQQGKVEVEKRLKSYLDPPRPEAPTSSAPADVVAVVDLDDEEKAGPTPVLAQDDEQPEPDEPLAPGAPEPPLAPGAPEPPPAVAELAIHGYDTLSASQVVQRLAGLSPAELEQVRLYEAATRRRKTVLTKISQLQ